MAEYLEVDHMGKVEDSNDAVLRVYLPYHQGIKESSTTIKSWWCLTHSARRLQALNDELFAGRLVQQDLRLIILRSQTRQVIVVSDVERMFRQIWINERDTPLHRILWFGPDNETVTYELITVNCGTQPAPF